MYLQGSVEGLPVALRAEADGSGGRWLPNDEWRGPALAWLLFDLSDEDLGEPGAPTARGLLSYFARRGRDGFSDPFTFFRSQRASSRQVLNAYLMGLDWRYPAQAQELREKADRLRKARQALAAVPLDGEAASGAGQTLEGELEARVIVLSRQVSEAAEATGGVPRAPAVPRPRTRSVHAHAPTPRVVSRERGGAWKPRFRACGPASPPERRSCRRTRSAGLA